MMLSFARLSNVERLNFESCFGCTMFDALDTKEWWYLEARETTTSEGPEPHLACVVLRGCFVWERYRRGGRRVCVMA